MAKRNEIVKLVISIVVPILLYALLAESYDRVWQAVWPDARRSASLFQVLTRVGLVFVVLVPWMKFYYNETPMRYLGTHPRRWHKPFMLAQVFLVVMFLLSEPLSLWLNWQGIEFRWVEDWRYWFIWLIPLVLAIAFQAGAEEFLFRGFYQDKFKALSHRWIVYGAVPSLIWALGHQAMFRTIDLKIAMVLQMAVLGLIFSDWTRRTGNIKGPLVAHILLNIFTMLFYVSSLRPSASYILYVDVSHLPKERIWLYFFLVSLASFLSYWFFVRRKLGADDD